MTSTSARTSGTLFIVATPIGNKNDISLRALDTLRAVDVILAEDTRHSIQLLASFGIKKPLQSLHAYNENDKSTQIVDQLKDGKSYALISDAGTPLISDPGFPLVSLARANDISIIPIPGACAFITALSASGVPCNALSFFGFLPAKAIARREKLKLLKNINHSLVFYESTHRIKKCLEDIGCIFGDDSQIVLAKELTKAFENIISGTINEVIAWLEKDSNHLKGEFVLIIPPRDAEVLESNHTNILKTLLQELPLKQAVKLTAEITNKPKNEIYKLALSLGESK